MAQPELDSSPKWKKPDEVMALHRLRKRKKALQDRMSQPSQSCPDLSRVLGDGSSFNLSRLLGGEKRKNPFIKNPLERNQKQLCEETEEPELDESSDKTLFQLFRLSNTKATKATTDDKFTNVHIPTTFTNILSNVNKDITVENDDQRSKKKNLPLDWSLKTRMRLMSAKPFAWNQKLKASEEASGITGFVRCLDTLNSCSLDTSHHARFHQNCLFWQHPSLPWLSLFPRCSGRVSKLNHISANEDIVGALHREWTESFRSLFQLLRARQCPYFYVCANSFTCLFHAAGIGGSTETSVFISPTTRGFRQTLKQEEIEFTMPLKKNTSKRKSNELIQKPSSDSKDTNRPGNSSFDSCYETMDGEEREKELTNIDRSENDDSADEDEMESEEWLQSLGVAAEEIKKINHSQMRMNHKAESAIDSGVESLVCIQGVDVQALFNFLLNCKSCIPTTGAFGGVPPTLLSPTAFQGAALQPLKVRESIVATEDGKYHSIELRGPILPTTIHSLCSLLQTNMNSFSATFANLQQTNPFSEAVRIVSSYDKSKENTNNCVFGRENLSDCGLNSELLQSVCSSEPSSMETIDSFKYCSNKKTYMWS